MSMREKDDGKGKSYRFYAVIGILTGSLVLILMFGVPWSTIFPPPSTVTPTEDYSTISITDFTSREILDELCHITVHGNDVDIDDTDEKYDITNYEVIVTTKDPADFDEDLSDYDHIRIRVSPDESATQYWTTYDYWFSNLGNNYHFDMYAYHEATDLYGNVLDITSGSAWDLQMQNGGDGGTGGINGTIPVWFPTVTKTELHLGDHYGIETDLADCSQTTLERLWDEKWWRSMPTLYSDAVDVADHDYAGTYEWITEAFAIKFDFNETLVLTDGDVDQVNITVECDYETSIEYTGTYIYIITTESWDTISGNFELNFEIDLAGGINCTDVYLGRISIPNRDLTGSSFGSLQTILTGGE